MEELLNVLYRNYINEYDAEKSKPLSIANEAAKGIDDALDELRELLSEKLYDKLYDKIIDSISDLQEAYFIAGFSQATKFLTNGKIDFFLNYD